MFCQFKDLVDIKMGCFATNYSDIKTKLFFDNIAVKIQDKLKNLNTCVRFDQQEEDLPYMVRGDRHRIDYIQ